MSLGELTKFIISGIISEENFTISENEDEDAIIINIITDDTNIGKIIGKDGKIINAIRIIIQEASSLRNGKNVKIEVNAKN